MDSICNPNPKFPWAPLAAWALGSFFFLLPGCGMIVNGVLKEGGMCIKTIIVGFVLNLLSWGGLCFWWLLVPLIFPLIAWLIGGYHGYVVFTKSK